MDFSWFWSASVFVEVNPFYPEDSDYNALKYDHNVIHIFCHVVAYFLFILDVQNKKDKRWNVVAETAPTEVITEFPG